MIDARRLNAANPPLVQYRAAIADALVVSCRASSSRKSDEIILTRHTASLILGVNLMPRIFDGVRFYFKTAWGGFVVVRIVSVNGEQVALNAETPRAFAHLLWLADVRLGFHMVLTQVPHGADGRIRRLQTFEEAGDAEQELAIGVLPVRPLVDPAAIKAASVAQIKFFIRRKRVELASALYRGAGAEADAIVLEMTRCSQVLQRWSPQYGSSCLVEIDTCKDWNARQGGDPNFALPGNGGYVGIVLLSGRVIKARFRREWGLSFNFCCPEIAARLAEVEIRMGDHVAYTPAGAVPAEDRLADVDHYYVVTKLPRPFLAAAEFADLWAQTAAVAPLVVPERDAALRSALEQMPAV